MSDIDDGGPAFPVPPLVIDGKYWDPSEMHEGHLGLSLRDWFAGQAIPELIRIVDGATAGRDDVPDSIAAKAAAKVVAIQAYQMADAMIQARKAKT